MQRFTRLPIRLYSASRIIRAEADAVVSGTAMKLNLCTPHNPIYKDKAVDKVILPGDDGEYGVTAGHSPLISQLQPGVVTIIHIGGETEKLFVSGGFALTHANSVTDVSVPEAVPLADLDADAIKAGFSAAQQSASSATTEKDKAFAQIELTAYSNLGRALGLAL